MCLYSLDIAVHYDTDEKAFVGTGYKILHKNKVKEYGDKWIKCTGDKHDNKFNPDSLTRSNTGVNYFPGFHMFTCINDTINYQWKQSIHIQLRYNSKPSYQQVDDRLVEVKYKEILAYGTDYTKNGNKPCVVARYMKVVRVVPLKEAKEYI